MLLEVGTSERAADRGKRRGKTLLENALREFHSARVGRSLSQELVGRSLGKSDAWVSWTESGRNTSLSVVDLSAMLACVGLELSLRGYPVEGSLRDAGQNVTLELFMSLVAPSWRRATEVPMPIPGDLRAWDCVLSDRGCTIGVEVEMRIRDFQALDRRVMLKLRDSRLDRVVILLPGTRSNRALLRALGPAAMANYPVPSRDALEALKRGVDPGGNSIIVLDRARKPVDLQGHRPPSNVIGKRDRPPC